jgi:hypothetical protein
VLSFKQQSEIRLISAGSPLTRLIESAAVRRLLTLVAALLLLASGQAAFAQASPTVLTKVTVLTDSPSETRLQLRLEPKANGFAPVGNDVNRPALGLALARRGSSAVTPPGLKGLVRQISFEQVETILILRFSVTSARTRSTSRFRPELRR